MANNVSVATVRTFVRSALSDAALEMVITEAEERIRKSAGGVQNDDEDLEVTLEFTIPGGSLEVLYTPQRIKSIESITLDGESVDLDTLLISKGAGIVQRLYGLSFSGSVIQLVYVPDVKYVDTVRVVSELVSLYLQRKYLQSESIGGEYAYSSGEKLEAQELRIVRRLLL